MWTQWRQSIQTRTTQALRCSFYSASSQEALSRHLEEGLVVDSSQVGQLVLIDGCKLHKSNEFEGQRCSFVAFYHTSVDSLPNSDKERLVEAGFRLSSPAVPRTRVAGAYTRQLCRSWATVIRWGL